jgi:phosphoglycolate phosphatase-like HAD superfamily hydrolase
MAVILPYHTPEPEELLELISETGVDAPQDIIVVEDGQLSYIPSKVVETI